VDRPVAARPLLVRLHEGGPRVAEREADEGDVGQRRLPARTLQLQQTVQPRRHDLARPRRRGERLVGPPPEGARAAVEVPLARRVELREQALHEVILPDAARAAAARRPAARLLPPAAREAHRPRARVDARQLELPVAPVAALVHVHHSPTHVAPPRRRLSEVRAAHRVVRHRRAPEGLGHVQRVPAQRAALVRLEVGPLVGAPREPRAARRAHVEGEGLVERLHHAAREQRAALSAEHLPC